MMSRRTLTRHFMKATGSSVAEWLIAERLRRSQTLLESSQLPVERIAEQVGFQSPVTGVSILNPTLVLARLNGVKPFAAISLFLRQPDSVPSAVRIFHHHLDHRKAMR